MFMSCFVTRTTPIADIDGKNHKMKKQQELFNQSYKVKITPLLFMALRHTHTCTRMHINMKVWLACAWLKYSLQH